MKKVALSLSLLFCSFSWAHRDSHIDNLTECEWNKVSLESYEIFTACNDLYHLYQPKSLPKMKRPSSFKIGAFNVFKLGSGDARFKDLALTANILKNYDVIAVTELQHSLSEEQDSNQNLFKHKDKLDFAKHYHKPGYLKLLLELRKSNSSWALVLSPAAQSDNEELAGFYFRTDRVQLENSDYCKVYNRKIRTYENLFYAGSYQGPTIGRRPIVPHLNKSFACLLDVEDSENSIFRLPFTARFKVATGFDFNYLAFHARFREPVAVGGACGFECLEHINDFLNNEFHKEGKFLGVTEGNSLRLLKNHLDFLQQKKSVTHAIDENYSPIIKFKHSKPRVYSNLIFVKSLLESSLEEVILRTWQEDDHGLSKTDVDRLIHLLLESSKNPIERQRSDFLEEHKKIIEAAFKKSPYSDVYKREDIWTSPAKISRFYELSIILKEMEKISSLESDADVLLGGDLNLEDSSNKYYWEHLSQNYRYSDVAIGSPTSISKSNGLASAYDHFLFDGDSSLEECMPLEASVLDFVNDRSYWSGFTDYFVTKREDLDRLASKVEEKVANMTFINTKGEVLAGDEITQARAYKNCWNDQYYRKRPLSEVWRNDFECRILRHYLHGYEKYRIYTDLISDHLPIGMKCNKTTDLD